MKQNDSVDDDSQENNDIVIEIEAKCKGYIDLYGESELFKST